MPEPPFDRRVGLILDPGFEKHDTGPTHPERPERLASVRRALAAAGADDHCKLLPPVRAEDEALGESVVAHLGVLLEHP